MELLYRIEVQTYLKILILPHKSFQRRRPSFSENLYPLHIYLSDLQGWKCSHFLPDIFYSILFHEQFPERLLGFVQLWYNMFTLEKIDDEIGGLSNSRVLRVDDEIRSDGYIVILIDTSETLNNTLAGLLIKSLNVTGFAYLEGCLDEYLEEGQIGVSVNLACHFPIRRERRYEAAEGDDASIREEPRDFGDATHILLAILFTEAKIAIQTGAHIVSVQTVCRNSLFEE